ncbi:hypothetical protein HGM15179_022478, partial [Zosterops borbonicus]
ARRATEQKSLSTGWSGARWRGPCTSSTPAPARAMRSRGSHLQPPITAES